VNDQIQDPASKVSARRRLIRGAFAAPAALTLYSGSVAARSINNCVTKQTAVTTPPAPGPTAEEGTTFVRVRLKRFNGLYGGGVKSNRFSRWVKGSDVVALIAAGTPAPYLTGSQWQLYDRGVIDDRTCSTSTFNPASKYAVSPVGTILGTQPDEAGSVACTDTTEVRTLTGNGPIEDEWVALRVNSSGQIVGVVGINDTAGTSAVYKSCWTSFRIG
jgi:hypothetical protein